MRYIRKIIIALLILLPLVVVFFAFNIYWGIDDAYAQWGAADMTIAYMETHEGNWPPDWEALRPNFESGGGRVGGWSFEQFQGRVAIDFNANVNALRQQSIESETAPFRVIHARWTIGSAMGGGPNAAIRRYFRRKAGIAEAPTPRGGWRSRNQKTLADDWYRRGFLIRFDSHGNIVAAWTTLVETAPPGDQDVAEFKTHPHLKELNLVGSHVTDAGLVFVRELPELEVLDLGSDNITDAGLEHLTGHPRLASLDLFGTRITDAGLQSLRELPKLVSIRFDERRISAEAVRKLKAAVPNLEIRAQGELRAPVE
ncbi:MAG: hypothetical protein HZA46_05830 [Planctomycetales bacterium]|nr:hypothetical protein [Planctomycetales bacterium]